MCSFLFLDQAVVKTLVVVDSFRCDDAPVCSIEFSAAHSSLLDQVGCIDVPLSFALPFCGLVLFLLSATLSDS